MSRFPALEHPEFRRYFIGQAIALIGGFAHNVGMAWLAYRLTGSVALLGAIRWANCRIGSSICRNYCTQRRRRTVLTSAFAHFAPRIHAQAVVARQGEDLAKSSKYRAANRDRAKPLGPAHAPVRTHLRFSEKRRTKKWPEGFRPRDVVPLDGLELSTFSLRRSCSTD